MPCGYGFVDLPMTIIGLIAEDQSGCHAVKAVTDTTETCATLTDIVSCGRKLNLTEVLLAALDSDNCTGAALKIYDLTGR